MTIQAADIMYLGPAFLFAVFASLFYVPGFLDTPLGTLTSRQLISELLFCVFALIALASLARSIEFDPVWPWRPGFRRLIHALLGRAQ
jgi:positive regulator of sigma E activity